MIIYIGNKAALKTYPLREFVRQIIQLCLKSSITFAGKDKRRLRIFSALQYPAHNGRDKLYTLHFNKAGKHTHYKTIIINKG